MCKDKKFSKLTNNQIFGCTKKRYLDLFQNTDSSECLRAKSEYSNYLLRASYGISNIDNVFQNFQLLSQETLIRTTTENQVKEANTPSRQKCITSFTPTYHPIIYEMHKIFHKNLKSTLDSSEQLKEILLLDTFKLSSRRDHNLKEISTFSTLCSS